VDCHKIKYLEHEWVGFKVETYTKSGEVISSLFEFEPYGDIGPNGIITTGMIKRVDYGNPIVATTDDGIWPSNMLPSVQGANPFRMSHKKDDEISTIPIGRIELMGYPTSIDLCADYNNTQDPWRKSYVFTAMTAETASGVLPSIFEERSDYSPDRVKAAWAKSPFNEYLDVFVPLDDPRDGTTKVYLLNTAGLLIMEQNVNVQCSELSFNTESLLSGLYIIRIESPWKVQTLKVIKSL